MTSLHGLPSPLSRTWRAVRRAWTFVRSRTTRRSRTHEIAYAILVSDEIGDFMRELQANLPGTGGTRPKFHAVPHITLKLGFEVPDIAPYERHLDALVEGAEPFEICVKNIGFFDEGIVFLDVEENPHLDRLRRRILECLSRQHGIEPTRLEGDQYRYHVTLAYDLAEADLAKARRQFENLTFRFRFVPDTLALLCYANGHWITHGCASLAKRPAQSQRTG